MEGIIQRHKWKVSGTCEWILEQPKYQTWLAAGDTQLLLLTGAPGIGKTTLSFFLVDRLAELEKDSPPIILAYYFCNYMQESRNTTAAILRGLLWQLLHPKHQLYLHVEDHYNWKRDDFSDNIDALKDMLLTLIKNSKREIHLLIDALDVCDITTRQDLLGTLTGMLERCPNAKFKIIITSRPEKLIEGLPCDKLNIEPEMIDADLREFIDTRINSLDIGRRLRAKLQEVLRRKAGGTFLWASHIIEEVRSIDLGDEDGAEKIERILEEIPTGLSDTYDWILSRISRSDERKALFILRMLTVTRQPMSVKDLRIAYHIHSRGKIPGAEELEGPSNIPQICGSLVSVDGEVVSLMHQSVKDYLQSDALRWNYHTGNCRRGSSLIPYMFLSAIVSAELCHMDSLCLSRLSAALSLLLMALFCSILLSSLTGSKTSTPYTLSWILEVGRHSCDDLTKHCHLISNALGQLLGAFGILSSVSRYHVVAERASLLYFRICVRYKCCCQDSPGRPFIEEWLEHALDADPVLSRDEFSNTFLDQTPFLRDAWLLGAAKRGKTYTVRRLLACGAQPESVDESGRTALSLAARHGHTSVVQLLVAGRGGTLQLPDEEDSWIHFSWPGRLLYEEGLNMDYQSSHIETADGDGATPLALAASNGHHSVVEYLLGRGGNLESSDDDGRTPLSRAAQSGHRGLVEFLVQMGAQVEAKDKEGQTPLSWAAENGHTGVVKFLFERGASLDVVDNYKHTPLSWATENGHTDVIHFLLANGGQNAALLRAKDRDGLTPLAAAVRRGHESVVQLLLSGQHTLLRSKDKHGLTPLSWAARNGDESIIKLLLAQGHAQLESKDNHGLTPLAWAVHMGHSSVVNMLLHKGAEIETPMRLVLQRGKYLEQSAQELLHFTFSDRPLGNALTMVWGLIRLHVEAVKLLVDTSRTQTGKILSLATYLAELSTHEKNMTFILDRGASMKTDHTHNSITSSPSSGSTKRPEKIIRQLLHHGTRLGSACKHDGTHEFWGRRHQEIFMMWSPVDSSPLLESIRQISCYGSDMSYFVKLPCQSKERTTLAQVYTCEVQGHTGLAVPCHLENDTLRAVTFCQYHIQDRWKHQLLMAAVGKGERALVRRLLRQNTTPLEYNKAGDCPIALAARQGLADIVQLLLDRDASLESTDTRGCTALSVASEEGHSAVVRLLLARGADLETRNQYGRSPLSWAAQKGRGEVVTLLLEAGADLESKDDKYGRTPLLWAVTSAHRSVVEQLLRKGARWNVQDRDGRSASDWVERKWGREEAERIESSL
ncbi:hypothetical protein FE257_007424 [Aspergillus nanangensis]|uniref:NACHT domain-containing protein n=1 Tax=Aspergillus nanangensis TaxID=2582783 RepID=A0AAD4GU57_ASPNN|nr:hypothetical protein FE257_007424 [Aspergillus nanangensis]